MNITYKIDGVNFNTYGVKVSSSSGITSRPKPKDPISLKWETYNGINVDLSKRYYEVREIELECFIVGSSPSDLVAKTNAFLALFDAAGTRRLSVTIDTLEPLPFEVYLSSELDVKKKWKDGETVGTFLLKLIEPEPIKKVLKYTRTGDANKTVSIAVTSSKMLNIYWGDGSHTFDVSGANQTITHNYANNGTYYPVVTGNIDEITSLTTTGLIIWNKL